MQGDKELFEMVNSHHRRSGTTQHIGYIVYEDQAEKLLSMMEAQNRRFDPVPLVVIALQVIVCGAVLAAILV